MMRNILGEHIYGYLAQAGLLGYVQIAAMVLAVTTIIARIVLLGLWRYDMNAALRRIEHRAKDKRKTALLQHAEEEGPGLTADVCRWLIAGDKPVELPQLVDKVVIGLFGVAISLGLVLTFAGLYQLLVAAGGAMILAAGAALALKIISSAIGYSSLFLDNLASLAEAYLDPSLRRWLARWRLRLFPPEENMS